MHIHETAATLHVTYLLTYWHIINLTYKSKVLMVLKSALMS